MGEDPRIFPRSSAFEALLAKVYLELWDIQDNPTLFAQRVETFVSTFLPTMFQTRINEKFPDFDEKLAKMETEIGKLERIKFNVDPLTAETIGRENIPAEEADFARDVWHAIVDILTEAGFNFPMAVERPRRKMGA